MWEAINSLGYKLHDLWLNRLTAARALLLENLNATITSRAPSSTALSNLVWSDAKAVFVDAAVSTRAEESPLLLPPMTGGVVGRALTVPVTDFDLPTTFENALDGLSSTGTWKDFFDITGSGLIDLAAIVLASHATLTATWDAELILDGAVVWSFTQNNAASNYVFLWGAGCLGTGSSSGTLKRALDVGTPLVFKSSAKLRLMISSGSVTPTATAYWNVIRTA